MSGEENSRAALYREWVSAVFTGWLSEIARRSRRLRDWEVADRREIIANARGRLLAEAPDLLSAPLPIYLSPLLQALQSDFAGDRVAQLVPPDRVQLALDVERQNLRNRRDAFRKLLQRARVYAEAELEAEGDGALGSGCSHALIFNPDAARGEGSDIGCPEPGRNWKKQPPASWHDRYFDGWEPKDFEQERTKYSFASKEISDAVRDVEKRKAKIARGAHRTTLDSQKFRTAARIY